MIKVIYRMSDASQVVPRPPYVNLQNCFLNFLQNFEFQKIDVICDNVKDETYAWVSEIIEGAPLSKIIRTDTNNAESFRIALDTVLLEADNTIIYFVEDDYIHRLGSMDILLEGLEISHYVSLYDHPDKFGPLYQYGEFCRVLITKSTHWKTTISCPMTFGATVKTLKRDRDIILQSLDNRTMTHSSWLFKQLYNKYKYQAVLSPIPGYACHGMHAWMSPFINWEKVMLDSLNQNDIIQ